MTDLAEAIADLTSAVSSKVSDLANARRDLLTVAGDMRRSVFSGAPIVSPEQKLYGQVFRQWLENPSGEKSLLQEAIRELARKDVTIASNPSGGYAVPKQLAAQIDRMASVVNPWLDDTVLGVTEVNTFDYHVPLGLSDVSSSRTTETGARSATATPAFRERIPAWGAYFGYATISNAAREDIPNLEDFLAREFAAQLGASLAIDIVSGSGSSGQVLGLTTTTPVTTIDAASPMRAAGALQYTFLAGATIVLADIENLLGAFQEAYLLDPSFSFVMRPSTWRTVLGAPRAGTVASTEAPFTMELPPTLYGYPVKLSTAVPAISANSFSILAGSWQRGYALVSRGPMLITADEVTVPGQTKFHVRRRYGGTVRANNAAKILKFGTS